MSGKNTWISFILAAGFFTFSPCLPSHAELKNENLTQVLPGGFRLASQSRLNGVNLQAWVPQAQSLDNWTEMVTTQIFVGRKDMDPVQFIEALQQPWLVECGGGGEPNMVTPALANGYLSATLFLHCMIKPSTGRPETTFFKAIKGDDSFYFIQLTYRRDLTKDQVAQAGRYLDTFNVCDTRQPQSPCPDLKGQNVMQ